MKVKYWSTTALLALNLISVRGWADEAQNNSPYIDPSQDCMSQGMMNPPGKNYRFLYSKDCKVVYVLPPPVMAQNIENVGVGLSACADLTMANERISGVYKSLNEIQKQIGKLEQRLDEAKNDRERRDIQKQIDALIERSKGYDATLNSLTAHRYERFVRVGGMKSSVTMVGTIDPNELNYIRGINAANLHRKTKVQEKDASGHVTKEYFVDEEAVVRPAPVYNSLYSFIYKTPDVLDPSESEVVEAQMPGVEILAQEGAKTKAVHVRANDVTSGYLRMSLVYACEHTKADPKTGELKIDESTDPLFTVNRTFDVQEMFGQGYTASLKIDKTVQQISRTVITNNEHGFKKSVVFLPTIKANVDQLVDFKWDTEFAVAGNIGMEKILEIKQQVATKFVDDYIEKLVQNKILSIETEPAVTPANGGTTDETRTANRCWTESDGGLSGLFGGRHTVCGDYQYVVQVWHDGLTTVDLDRLLTLDVANTETMKVNMMAPFTFTTAFVKNP